MSMLPENERPPVFRRWRTWYLLLIGALATLILLFYLFMKLFS